MLVEDFHPLEHNVRPLFRTVGVGLALHVLLEQAHRSGFKTDEQVLVAMLPMCRGPVLVARQVNGHGKFRDQRRVANDRRHRRMCDVDVLHASHMGIGVEQAFQRRDIGVEFWTLFVEEEIFSDEQGRILRPPLPWTRTLCRIWSSGMLLPLRKATEQNWQPRPQPRVISTVPNVERWWMRGTFSSLGLLPSTLRGGVFPLTAASNSDRATSSASPCTTQSTC